MATRICIAIALLVTIYTAIWPSIRDRGVAWMVETGRDVALENWLICNRWRNPYTPYEESLCYWIVARMRVECKKSPKWCAIYDEDKTTASVPYAYSTLRFSDIVGNRSPP